MKSFLFVLFAVSAITSAELIFYDDFEDNNIDDWTPQGQSGTWWAADGKAHGSTNNNWSGISPPGSIVLENCVVEASGTANHTVAVFLRLDGTDSGINATVSPDHDIAVIRTVINGVAGDALGAIYHDFPSGVWYDITFSCNGDSIFYEIDIPSTGEYFSLSAIDPNPHPGECGLAVGDEAHGQYDWFSISEFVEAGELVLNGLSTDDDNQGGSSGNGNWAFEVTEEIELGIELLNACQEPLNNTFAVLQSLDTRLVVSEPIQDYGTVPAGQTCWNQYPFLVYASPGTPEDETYPFRMSIFADDGYYEYLYFELPLGAGLFYDVESDTSPWTMSFLETGWQNNWHVTSQRNHTSGGYCSFKCGDTGAGDYDDNLFCGLTSPWFNLPLDGNLSFWIWIDAQIYSAVYQDLALDGGLVQLGQFDNWTTVEPSAGYPFEIVQPTFGPFEPGTGLFSGYQGWHLVNVDIPAEIKGPQQLRFIFGSDNAGTREGWYVDDILVTGSTGIEEHHGGPGYLESISVYPNPFSESISVSVPSGDEGEYSIRVFDLSGRLVYKTVFSGSNGTLVWGATDMNGCVLPAGVYTMLLQTTESSRSIRLIKLSDSFLSSSECCPEGLHQAWRMKQDIGIGLIGQRTCAFPSFYGFSYILGYL